MPGAPFAPERRVGGRALRKARPIRLQVRGVSLSAQNTCSGGVPR